jgi:hypothetical protein
MQAKKIILVLGLVFSFQFSFSQSFFKNADSLHKNRTIGITALYTTSWTSSILALNYVWYSDYPSTKIHTFNDWDEWLQMDKFGHIYTAYHISKSVALFNRWAGMKKVPAAIVGSAFALGYQTTLEILDGKSADWGFSWGDMAANTLGAAAYASQEYFFDNQRILLKQSYLPTEYALLRPQVLGDNFVQRYLKDYNGQTYWFSFAPVQFSSNIPLPKWFCLSVGYGIDGKLYGTDNKSVFDGITYNANRRFLFSFDIDLTQLNIKNKTLKTLIKPFNAIKIPFPTIYWQNNVCYVKGLYF